MANICNPIYNFPNRTCVWSSNMFFECSTFCFRVGNYAEKSLWWKFIGAYWNYNAQVYLHHSDFSALSQTMHFHYIGFLFFWGCVFLLTTTLVWLFKHEKDDEDVEDHGIVGIKRFSHLLSCAFDGFDLFCAAGFAFDCWAQTSEPNEKSTTVAIEIERVFMRQSAWSGSEFVRA